jgi:hypothetical protein
MLGKASKRTRKRLEERGIPGVAVIQNVRDTGMSIGGDTPLYFVADLTLEVHVEGRQPYQVIHRQRIPRLQIGQMVPGARIGVTVDPEDQNAIMVTEDALSQKVPMAQWSAPPAVGSAPAMAAPGAPSPGAVPPMPAPPAPQQAQPKRGGLFGMLQSAMQASSQAMGQDADTQRVLITGTPGVATVLAVRDSGITVGGETPLYFLADLDLQVQVEGWQPYTITHRQAIQRLQVGQIVPGVRLAVKVDPANPASIALMTG